VAKRASSQTLFNESIPGLPGRAESFPVQGELCLRATALPFPITMALIPCPLPV
jgi:hypothetical protein